MRTKYRSATVIANSKDRAEVAGWPQQAAHVPVLMIWHAMEAAAAAEVRTVGRAFPCRSIAG
jgi:hypothetical protein